jgi:hypothetical protein
LNQNFNHPTSTTVTLDVPYLAANSHRVYFGRSLTSDWTVNKQMRIIWISRITAMNNLKFGDGFKRRNWGFTVLRSWTTIPTPDPNKEFLELQPSHFNHRYVGRIIPRASPRSLAIDNILPSLQVSRFGQNLVVNKTESDCANGARTTIPSKLEQLIPTLTDDAREAARKELEAMTGETESKSDE